MRAAVSPQASERSFGKMRSRVQPMTPKRGATWLAAVLGVSKQRARKLLAEGRIKRAKRDPITGEWDLSHVLVVSVVPGKRGPKLRKRL